MIPHSAPAAACIFLALTWAPLASQADDPGPAIVENYYKVKWGHQTEFIELYKKNHYPLLKSLMDAGYVRSIRASRLMLHMAGASRWDYRITIVFRDLEAALLDPPPEWQKAKEKLYPDEEAFEAEERRRFEILKAHWDVAVSKVELE